MTGTEPEPSPDKIRIGVSTCLLGQEVRWDGGHRRDHFITDTLSRYVDFVPVCPEVEAGLGVPREPLHLEGDPAQPRLVARNSRTDHTEHMEAWANIRVAELSMSNLCAFIFKSRSPSSGMERVEVYDRNGIPSRRGVGIFARIFMEALPLVPVEEEGRLNDPGLRENFVERIFTLKRWREDVETRPSRRSLVEFHTRHKFLILSHDPEVYRVLGRLVATARHKPLRDVLTEYVTTLMPALKKEATKGRHRNVLDHAVGYFRYDLTSEEKRELREILAEYDRGNVPLIVPVTLLKHYVRKYRQPYLSLQHYLNPHPLELQLRNHA